MESPSNIKPNIGVFTDPKHNLWIDEAQPSAADVQSGAALAQGEVVVEIRSTGICGYVVWLVQVRPVTHPAQLRRTFLARWAYWTDDRRG